MGLQNIMNCVLCAQLALKICVFRANIIEHKLRVSVYTRAPANNCLKCANKVYRNCDVRQGGENLTSKNQVCLTIRIM